MVTTSHQYYQYLYALNSGGNAIQLPNGSWQQQGESWALKAACREETNGKGSTINTADGKSLVFASLIQLPPKMQRIDEGTEVLVTRKEVDTSQLLNKQFIRSAKSSGLIVAHGRCQKFDLGRLHCRLWI